MIHCLRQGKGRGEAVVEHDGMGQSYQVGVKWQPASSGHTQEEARNWNSRAKTDLKKG